MITPKKERSPAPGSGVSSGTQQQNGSADESHAESDGDADNHSTASGGAPQNLSSGGSVGGGCSAGKDAKRSSRKYENDDIPQVSRCFGPALKGFFFSSRGSQSLNHQSVEALVIRGSPPGFGQALAEHCRSRSFTVNTRYPPDLYSPDADRAWSSWRAFRSSNYCLILFLRV